MHSGGRSKRGWAMRALAGGALATSLVLALAGRISGKPERSHRLGGRRPFTAGYPLPPGTPGTRCHPK